MAIVYHLFQRDVKSGPENLSSDAPIITATIEHGRLMMKTLRYLRPAGKEDFSLPQENKQKATIYNKEEP
ncbi:MAG: hypothetical protein AB2L14_12755 [Candidatus Xenobiia bacterium LiM19]